jgi:outer membrane lipoprotein-sorting protein
LVNAAAPLRAGLSEDVRTMMTVLITLAAVCAQQDASFDKFFAEFAAKRDGIEYLEAKFVQENVSRGDVTYSEGTIIYAKPKRIIFMYEKPEPRTVYLIEGRRAYEFEEDISQLQIYDLEDNPQTEIFFLGFDSDTENLRKAYDVELFDADDPAQGKRGIELRPKAEPGQDETGRFKSVRISLRDKDFLPYLIYIVNDEDSQSYIRVKEYKINEKMDPVRTQIMIPAGVKVIENDSVIETIAEGGKLFPAQPASSLLPPGSQSPAAPEAAPKEDKPLVTSTELAPPSAQQVPATPVPAPAPAPEKKP